jgi:hypothetical protein
MIQQAKGICYADGHKSLINIIVNNVLTDVTSNSITITKATIYDGL